MQYAFVATLHDGTLFVVEETITPSAAANILTGTTIISLAGVGAEHVNIYGAVTQTGYTFSYIGTIANEAVIPSTTMSLDFRISVPSNFLQVLQVESLSPLILLSGLLAISGGVLTAGTAAGRGFSRLQKWRANCGNASTMDSPLLDRTSNDKVWE